MVEGLHGLRLGGRNNMGVNIRRRTGLGVSERLGYDHQRCAISDHQTGVCMAEGTDRRYQP